MRDRQTDRRNQSICEMKNRDRSLDFLKGIAMILVILTHIIPNETRILYYNVFHIVQAVPIFVFISSYLMSSKNVNSKNIFKEYFSKNNTLSFVARILIPVLSFSLVMFVFSDIDFISYLKRGLLSGAGSYYMMIYIQIWFSIPIISFFQQNILKKRYLIIIQILCIIILEILIFNMIIPNWFYRLFMIRYLLLIYLGVLFQKLNVNKISFPFFMKSIYNWKLLILGIASGLILYLIEYKSLRSPLLPATWQWFSYATDFYLLLYVFLLSQCYTWLSENFITKIGCDMLVLIGKNSLYIYLLHMSIDVFFWNLGEKNLVMSILLPLLILELKPKLMSLREV